MDKEDLMLIALAAGIAYYFLKIKKANSANTINNVGKALNGISEIFTGAQAGSVAYGWRYFSDGTAISPKGAYYQDGHLIWSPK